jgi:hypothetical protein
VILVWHQASSLFEKCVMVMDTPASFIPHKHPLMSVEKYLDLLGHFSCHLSCVDWLV